VNVSKQYARRYAEFRSEISARVSNLPPATHLMLSKTQSWPNILHNDTLTLSTAIIALETLGIDNMREGEAAVVEFFEQVQALTSIEGDSFSFMEIQRMVTGYIIAGLRV
jgi:hypothetical protein